MRGCLAPKFAGFLTACVAFSALAGPLFAAPRRVAIVNGASDQQAGAQAASELRRVIDRLPELAPVPTGNLTRALEEPLPAENPESRDLAQASAAIVRAQTHLEAFAFDRALAELDGAESTLIALVPSDAVRKRLAELNVRRGVVYMAIPDRAKALDAFRLARRLDPSRDKLDVAVFDPVVVKTFAAAGAAVAANATLEVNTDYDQATVYVDGHRVDERRLSLPAGRHLVTSAFAEHRTSGRAITLSGGQTLTIKLDQQAQSAAERRVALRRQLVAGNGAGARAIAQTIATLTGIDAVVIVRGASPGQIDVAVYDGRADKVSDWKPLQGAEPRKLLAPILPEVRITPIPGPEIVIPPPPPPPEPWYKQTRWQVVMGSGAAVTILGALTFALTRDGGPGKIDATWASDPFN